MAGVTSFLCFALLALLPYAFFYVFFRLSSVIPEVAKKRIHVISSVILAAHLVISSSLFFIFLISLGISAIRKGDAALAEQPFVCYPAVRGLTFSLGNTVDVAKFPSQSDTASYPAGMHGLLTVFEPNQSKVMEWSCSGKDTGRSVTCEIVKTVGGLDSLVLVATEAIVAAVAGDINDFEICFMQDVFMGQIGGGNQVYASQIALTPNGHSLPFTGPPSCVLFIPHTHRLYFGSYVWGCRTGAQRH